jgi:hypothetical protein
MKQDIHEKRPLIKAHTNKKRKYYYFVNINILSCHTTFSSREKERFFSLS